MPAEWMAPFLETLTETPNVSAACRRAGVSRKTAYLHRNTDPEFRDAWQDALESSVDDLVGDAWGRAKGGSDTLTIFLLKCHRPSVYQEAVKQQHEGGVTIRVRYDDADALPAPPAPGPAPDHGGGEAV